MKSRFEMPLRTAKLLLLFVALSSLFPWLQCQASTPELQIHHINVFDGDCTAIVKHWENDTTGDQEYDLLAIIDGGQSTFNIGPNSASLKLYLERIFGGSLFDYVILTHYHEDHMRGFDGLGSGLLQGVALIDPGGYTQTQLNNADPSNSNANSAIVPPVYTPTTSGPVNPTTGVFFGYLSNIKKANINYGLSRSIMISKYPDDLGVGLNIGYIDGVPITLTCIAANGSSLGTDGDVVNNRISNRTNANNYSLAFMLTFGEFRYFIGGDLGGDGQSNNCSAYINQESTLTEYFTSTLDPVKKYGDDDEDPETFIGHICCYRASHHGSKCSNNATMIETIKPSVVVTTANPSKYLPSSGYVNRLATNWSTVSDITKGAYFHQLGDWNNGDNVQETCDEAFDDNMDYSYAYGNEGSLDYSFVVTVTKDSEGSALDYSYFKVTKIYLGDISYDETPVATFKCHYREDYVPIN